MGQTCTPLFQLATRGHCQRPRVGSVVMGTWSTQPLGNESDETFHDWLGNANAAASDFRRELGSGSISSPVRTKN
jgi:hypothetical protein